MAYFAAAGMPKRSKMVKKAVKTYNLRDLRLDLKMSQEAAAVALGIGLRTWQRREAKGFSSDDALRFVNGLGGFLPPSDDIFRHGDGLFKVADYET